MAIGSEIMGAPKANRTMSICMSIGYGSDDPACAARPQRTWIMKATKSPMKEIPKICATILLRLVNEKLMSLL